MQGYRPHGNDTESFPNADPGPRNYNDGTLHFFITSSERQQRSEAIPNFPIQRIYGAEARFISMEELSYDEHRGISDFEQSMMITANESFALEQRALGRKTLYVDNHSIDWSSAHDVRQKFHNGFMVPLHDFLGIRDDLPSFEEIAYGL